MERRHQKIKPLLRRELHINSDPAFRSFIKKGLRIIPKLTVEQKDTSSSDYRNQKTVKKMKLLRIFKQIKHVQKLDVNRLLLSNTKFYSPTLLYIGKRMSSLSDLSIYESREVKSYYQRKFASWPKYMRHLKSLRYGLHVEKPWISLFTNQPKDPEALNLPERISLATDILRYLPKVKVLKVDFPYLSDYVPQMNGFWDFRKYSLSLEKICFFAARYDQSTLNSSLTRLKNLKDLTMEFQLGNSAKVEPVYEQISQMTQLESLSIRFCENFEIDNSVCAGFKQLTKLKNLKIDLNLLKVPANNLQILKNFEECPLENFNLRIAISSEQDLLLIQDFLSKKKYLKRLELRISKGEVFKSFKNVEELLKLIDDMSQLTHLSFFAQTRVYNIPQKQILPEIDFPFKKLFTKLVPLKKFTIYLNQHTFSKKGFFSLLEPLKEISSTLEKVEINVGAYKPKDSAETDAIINFIRSLTNIRSLRLASVDIPLRPFFLEIIDVIYTLKNLRSLQIGEVSGKVTKPSFMDGVEKILSKYGLEKFICETSADFKKAMVKKNVGCPPINIKDLRQKNPYLRKWPHGPMFVDHHNSGDW